MGQYYKPIFLKDRKTIDTYTSTDPTTGKEVKTKAFFYSHKYGNGLKLMEHSYVGNHLVNAVNNYLLDHNGGRLVWAGDYADEEPVRLPMAKTLPIWQKHVAEGLTTLSHKQFRLTSPLCIDKENGHTLYHKCGDGDGILDYDCSERDAICYYVNHDKKQVVELWETVVECDGYRVHPLPLLTCEGNGRGGVTTGGATSGMSALGLVTSSSPTVGVSVTPCETLSTIRATPKSTRASSSVTL